ncbi:MAG: hypothetical protein Q9162_000397 [Coniocarpon cinnabarinum]
MTTTSGSVWNPDNIRDVAESAGASALTSDAVDHLTRDVEFRIGQVLEEALKCMRHAKRTTLFTQDISQALRILDQEPLYGYESTRPLRFGEASIGPGQPLFYVEDEEVDFEKLINAPLPKVPREITFTAHWLAVEGVQPTIPQNPAPADSRQSDLLPKGQGANPHTAALAGADNLSVKPQVKHVLSQELQLFFAQACAAVLDEGNPEFRAATLTALNTQTQLHQLLPYFVHYIAEKVTHSMKNLFILGQMLHLTDALIENQYNNMQPYIAQLTPPILTCLVGRKLGPTNGNSSNSFTASLTNGHTHNHPEGIPAHYALRDLAASLLSKIVQPKFADATPSLKPRILRALLKHLLSPNTQTAGTYYGALKGISVVAGSEGARVLLFPNLASLNDVLMETIGDEGTPPQEREKRELELRMVVRAAVEALAMLEEEDVFINRQGGDVDEEERKKLFEKLGSLVGQGVLDQQRSGLVKAVLRAGEVGLPE